MPWQRFLGVARILSLVAWVIRRFLGSPAAMITFRTSFVRRSIIEFLRNNFLFQNNLIIPEKVPNYGTSPELRNKSQITERLSHSSDIPTPASSEKGQIQQ
jgi:hypothetical protein